MSEIWALPDDPLVAEVESAADQLGLAERYVSIDRDPRFPRAEYRGLGERRLLGLTVPTSAGGRGLPLVRAAVLLHRLAYRGGTTFAKLALQPEFCSVLRELGTAEQRTNWFGPLLRGERLVGNQITEPSAGSDLRAIATEARVDGDGFRLNGTKSEAAFAVDAEAAIVYARLSDPSARPAIGAFLVPQDLPGVERSVYPDDMGERWQRRGSITYRDVRLPSSARLGPEADAFGSLVQELVQERGLLSAIYLGVARAALDETVAHVGVRTAFGRRLADHQGVAFPLAESAAAVEAAWLLVRDALERLDRGERSPAPTAAAKVVATRTALSTLDRAIQFHGGLGYSGRAPHEQRYRDVRSGAIAHGSSEVLLQTVARTIWPRAHDALPRAP